MTEASSRRALAKAIGKSESAVRKWLANPEWPFGQSPPWNIAKVKAWAKRSLAPNPAETDADVAPAPSAAGVAKPLSAERQAKLRLTREKLKRARLDRALLEGRLVDRAEVEAQRLARIQAVKAALLALPRLAGRLVGMTESEISTVLEGEVTKILHGFAHDPPGDPDRR